MSVTMTERVPIKFEWSLWLLGKGHRFPRHPAVLLLAATLCLGAALSVRADDKTDLEKLIGDWVVIAENEGGKAADAKEVEATHTIFTFSKDGKFMQVFGDSSHPTKDASGTYKIDATKTPREMDLIIRTSDGKERDIPAIYELDKDRLRIAMPNRLEGAKRPTNFEGKRNITVFVCRRK